MGVAALFGDSSISEVNIAWFFDCRNVRGRLETSEYVYLLRALRTEHTSQRGPAR